LLYVLAARIDVANQEPIGVRVVCPSNTPERISTMSLRAVASHAAEGTGFAAIELALDILRVNAIPGGQPSTTHPIAGRDFHRRR
jgi:hypothetical protein